MDSEVHALSPGLARAFDTDPFSSLATNNSEDHGMDLNCEEELHGIRAETTSDGLSCPSLHAPSVPNVHGTPHSSRDAVPTARSPISSPSKQALNQSANTSLSSHSSRGAVSTSRSPKSSPSKQALKQSENSNMSSHSCRGAVSILKSSKSSPSKRTTDQTLSPSKRPRLSPIIDFGEIVEIPREIIVPELLDLTKSKLENIPVHVQTLSQMFPEADPQYLWDQCEKLEDEEALNVLIVSMLTNNDYPRVWDVNHSAVSTSQFASKASSLKSAAISRASAVASFTESNISFGSTSTGDLPSSVNSGASTSKTEECSKSDAPKAYWQDHYSTLLQFLPDADPSYLKSMAKSFLGKDEEVKLFIANALEKKNKSQLQGVNSNNTSSEHTADNSTAVASSITLNIGDAAASTSSFNDKEEEGNSSIIGIVATSIHNDKEENPCHSETLVSEEQKGKKLIKLENPCLSNDVPPSERNEAPREPWQDQYETFLQILPAADPMYLERMSRLLCGKDEEIKVFIADALEKQEYPGVWGSYRDASTSQLPHKSVATTVSAMKSKDAASSSSTPAVMASTASIRPARLILGKQPSGAANAGASFSSTTDVLKEDAAASGSSIVGFRNSEVNPSSEPWQNQYETFLQILPDADPSYLEKMSRHLCGKEEEIRLFLADALEKRNYPQVWGHNHYASTSQLPHKSVAVSLSAKESKDANSTSSISAVTASTTSIRPAKLILDNDPSDDVITGASSSSTVNVTEKNPYQHITIVSNLDEVKKRMSMESAAASESSDVGTKNSEVKPSSESWNDQYETFLQILPDADPIYLEKMSRLLCGKEEEIRIFVAKALEKRDYPLVKGYSHHASTSQLPQRSVAFTSSATESKDAALTSSISAVAASTASIKPARLILDKHPSAAVNAGASSSSTANVAKEDSLQETSAVSSFNEVKKISVQSSAASESNSSISEVKPVSEPWQDRYDTFLQIFPDADPPYLKDMARSLQGKEEELRLFVADALENRLYPLKSASGSASVNFVGSAVNQLASTAGNIVGAVNEGASTSSSVHNPSQQLVEVSSLSEVKKRMSMESLNAPAESTKVDVPREPWQEQLDLFIQILPDADPSFLEEQARTLSGKEDEIRNFVAEALEKKEYPSRKDWQWRQEQLALQKKYTEEFSIENFLEIIPDPFSYFSDPKRHCDRNMGEMFLRHKYRKLKVADINSVFSKHKYNLTLTCRALDRWKGTFLKSRRSQVEYDIIKKDGGKGIDLPFLQEVAFIQNEPKIVKYLDDKKEIRQKAFEKAKAEGDLLECQCCFDDEVLSEDIRTCTEGHTFCVTCVQKSSEQRIGDGETTFPCLSECTAEFKLQTLQEILKPTVFSRLVQRKQAEEVKAAGIEDLVQCPFCDFCNIPPKEDKIFRCLNPDCMKESCRLCNEESHIPLRCDEVEKKTDVEMRTYIENKMTEALVRTCWKCKKKFVKSDGCNKMRCQCGAMMCYICRQPVQDYSHFNGQGGDAVDRCPLWSNNDQLHVEAVAKVALEAKQEVLAKIPEGKLKHDPTANLPKYQPNQARQLPGVGFNPALLLAQPIHRHRHGHRHHDPGRAAERERRRADAVRQLQLLAMHAGRMNQALDDAAIAWERPGPAAAAGAPAPARAAAAPARAAAAPARAAPTAAAGAPAPARAPAAPARAAPTAAAGAAAAPAPIAAPPHRHQLYGVRYPADAAQYLNYNYQVPAHAHYPAPNPPVPPAIHWAPHPVNPQARPINQWQPPPNPNPFNGDPRLAAPYEYPPYHGWYQP